VTSLVNNIYYFIENRSKYDDDICIMLHLSRPIGSVYFSLHFFALLVNSLISFNDDIYGMLHLSHPKIFA